MSKNNKVAQTALASVVSLALLGTSTQPALAASKDVKCYGVAAASKNDCGTIVSACAASIKQAGACYSWIFAPKGVCEKIVGASVGKPASDCKGPNGQPVTQ